MSVHLLGWEGEAPKEAYMVRGTPVFQTVSTVFKKEEDECYWLGTKRISDDEFLTMVKGGFITLIPGMRMISVGEGPVEAMLIADREAPQSFLVQQASCVQDIRFSLYYTVNDLQEEVTKITDSLFEAFLNTGAVDAKVLSSAFALDIRNPKVHALAVLSSSERSEYTLKRAKALLSEKDLQKLVNLVENNYTSWKS